MDTMMIGVASAMRGALEGLDVSANNLANVASPGYKADRENYAAVWSDVQNGTSGFNLEPGPFASPTMERVWTDYRQGSLQTTGSETDLAIDGDGFFAVRSAGETQLIRGGSMRISQQGRFVTPSGAELETKEGLPYQIDPTRPMRVDGSGVIHQDGRPIASLKVVQVKDVQSLTKRGDSIFVAPDSAALQPASGRVWQGRLEASNQPAAEAAIRVVTLMRQFESMQRVAHLAGDMNRLAAEELSKSGG